MKREVKLALAVGGTLAGVVGLATLAKRSAPPPAPVRPRKIALIGDSYAEGLGPELAKSLPNFDYRSVRGSSPAQWVKGMSAQWQWLQALQPTVVLVSLGVNGGAPSSSDLHAIAQAVHGIGATTVWIEPPAGVTAMGVNPGNIDRTIEALGVPFIPSTATPIGADGLHPASYSGWADEVAQAVAKVT